jgi:hypothetical protein
LSLDIEIRNPVRGSSSVHCQVTSASESLEIDSEFCDVEKLIAGASGYPGNAGATKDNIRAL